MVGSRGSEADMTALGKHEYRGRVGAQGWLNVGWLRKFSLRSSNENDDLAIGRSLHTIFRASKFVKISPKTSRVSGRYGKLVLNLLHYEHRQFFGAYVLTSGKYQYIVQVTEECRFMRKYHELGELIGLRPLHIRTLSIFLRTSKGLMPVMTHAS